MGIVEDIESFVPPPDWDGNGSYRTVFHTGFMNYFRHLEFYALLVYVGVLILQRISVKMMPKQQNQSSTFEQSQSLFSLNRSGMLPYQQLQSSNNLQNLVHQQNNEQMNTQIQNQQKDQNQIGFILELLGYLSLWSLIALLTFQFALTYGFKLASLSLTNSINCVIVIIGLILQTKANLGKRRYLKIIFVIIGLGMTIIPSMLTENLCMCVFNIYGYQIGDFFFSSKFTRYYQIEKKKVCSDNEICHFYATLPETTYNSVFFNIHTGTNIQNVEVILKDINNLQLGLEQTYAQIQDNVQLEQKGERNVFVALFTNLQPDTTYAVLVKDLQTGIIHKKTTYKTLPSPDQKDHSLKIAFGGDWSKEGNGDELTSKLLSIQPDVIMLGGDVGYDNGFVDCYYSWDILYGTFENNVFDKLNRIIPFIFSVGNHDVGWNALGQHNLTVTAEEGPLYFTWAPQQFGENNTIPKYSERSTLNYHIMRNTIHFSLDSGYQHVFSDYQNQWMKETLAQHSDLYKFAIYHVPIYPVCLNTKSKFNKNQTNIDMKNYWVPLFDQYHFVGVFENHVHKFKRTFPMRNNTLHEHGTVFYGDGAWGVPTNEVCPPDQFMNATLGGIFEKAHITDNADHVWILQLDEKSAVFDAFTQDGYLEKGYTQTLSNYDMN